jgi:hypothetical protein
VFHGQAVYCNMSFVPVFVTLENIQVPLAVNSGKVVHAGIPVMGEYW